MPLQHDGARAARLEKDVGVRYLSRMIPNRTGLSLALITAMLLPLTACGGAADPLGDANGPLTAPEAVAGVRYYRELVFVGSRGDEPLVVPFSFGAAEAGSGLERTARGWLARGATWDRFLDDAFTTSAAGGVWRLVPHANLRVAAGGPAEIEALWFQEGERRLRLELEAPTSNWNQGGDARFRLVRARLLLGPETVRGSVLEKLRVERPLDDGWPPGQDFDGLFLTSGDSIQLVLAESVGGEAAATSYAWARLPAGERAWSNAEIRWLDMRPYQEARRDLPRRWTFRIPAADIEGELEAAGYDVVLGPERAGRRAVEVRYTVRGWVYIQGEQAEIVGMIRHTQQ
jgi:hypothetical protein